MYSPGNLALYGKATQSFIAGGKVTDTSHAYNAIDGNRNPDINAGSCSRSSTQSYPWWRVDLLDSYIVTSVSITNANTNPEKLNGAQIRIGDSIESDGLNNKL